MIKLSDVAPGFNNSIDKLKSGSVERGDFFIAGTEGFVVSSDLIGTPEAVFPIDGAIDAPRNVQIQGSPFLSAFPKTRDFRRTEIRAFGALDWETLALESEVNSDFAVVPDPILDAETQYEWRVRDVATDGTMSEWSVVSSFTTGVIYVEQPTLTAQGAPENVPQSPLLASSPFVATGGADTHESSDWEVRSLSNELLWSSYGDTVNLLSIQVPEGIIDENTEYEFKVRYNGTNAGPSPFDSVTALTIPEFVKFLATTFVNSSPYIHIYSQDGDSLRKVVDVDAFPSSQAYGVGFSPDGTHLAVGRNSSRYLYIYNRNGEQFTKIADPDVDSGVSPYGIAYSPDGTHLAVGSQGTPYLTIYNREGNTYTKLVDPVTQPPSTTYDVAYSPDGIYLCVAHANSPFASIYFRTGNTYTKLANGATTVNPNSPGYSTAFSADNQYLAVGHGTSRYIIIYFRDGNTFTKVANPDVLPPSNVNGVSFSPDGSYLAAAHNNSPYITIYFRDGNTFTKVADPDVLPNSSAQRCVFSSDGKYLAVVYLTSPYLAFYFRTGNTFTRLANPNVNIPNAAYNCAYYPHSVIGSK